MCAFQFRHTMCSRTWGVFRAARGCRQTSLPLTATRYQCPAQLASEEAVIVQEACWLITCSFKCEAGKRVTKLLAKDGGNGAN